jgi:hypothetical protein
MGIYHFTFDRNEIPAGARLVAVEDARPTMGSDVYGPRPMWTYETHRGVCLFESEANGSWDSDFYMTYWDEATQAPVRTMFATTRGWTYPCMGSHADATPEVRAKYEAWKVARAEQMRRENRRAQAIVLCKRRATIKSVASAHGVNYARLLKLRKHPKFDGMLALFGSRIKNGFRLSMRAQLVKWCNEGSQYPTPFSRKQLEYI